MKANRKMIQKTDRRKNNKISKSCREARKETKSKFKLRPDGKYDTGHPTKMTQETLAILKAQFSIGVNDVNACYRAGISYETLRKYQIANPEFVAEKMSLRESLIDDARAVIARDIREHGDTQTAKWYLEKRKPDEFGNKVQVEDVTPPKIIDDIAVIMEMQDKEE